MSLYIVKYINNYIEYVIKYINKISKIIIIFNIIIINNNNIIIIIIIIIIGNPRYSVVPRRGLRSLPVGYDADFWVPDRSKKKAC